MTAPLRCCPACGWWAREFASPDPGAVCLPCALEFTRCIGAWDHGPRLEWAGPVHAKVTTWHAVQAIAVWQTGGPPYTPNPALEPVG